jgi:hypothetical protein
MSSWLPPDLLADLAAIRDQGVLPDVPAGNVTSAPVLDAIPPDPLEETKKQVIENTKTAVNKHAAPIPVPSGNIRAQQKHTPDPSQQLVTRLTVLLAPKKAKGALTGAPTTRTDLKAVQRRVNRCDGTSGVCKKTGELFAAILTELNEQLFRETGFKKLVILEEVLKHMPEGAKLHQRLAQNVQMAVKAAAAGEMVASSKRATRGTLVGILAQSTSVGQLSTREVSELTGMSKSHVKQNRKKVTDGDLGTLGSLNKVPNGTHQACPESETVTLLHFSTISLSLSFTHGVCVCVRVCVCVCVCVYTTHRF